MWSLTNKMYKCFFPNNVVQKYQPVVKKIKKLIQIVLWKQSDECISSSNVQVVVQCQFMVIIKKYPKCFFEILVKLWRKFEETRGILRTNFLIFWWKFCEIFWSVFGKTYKKVLEKYEKYFMVSVSFNNTVITLRITTTTYFLTSNQLMFQFLLGFKLRVSNDGSPACDNNICPACDNNVWVIREWVTIIFTWV